MIGGGVVRRGALPSHRPAGREAGEYLPQSHFDLFLSPAGAFQMAKPNMMLKARELVGIRTEVNLPGQLAKCRRMQFSTASIFGEKSPHCLHVSQVGYDYKEVYCEEVN